jgi:hypothetical protein
MHLGEPLTNLAEQLANLVEQLANLVILSRAFWGEGSAFCFGDVGEKQMQILRPKKRGSE